MNDPRDEPLNVDEIFALYLDGPKTDDRVLGCLQVAWNMATIKQRQEEIERLQARLTPAELPL
jgi:hypothetical protein